MEKYKDVKIIVSSKTELVEKEIMRYQSMGYTLLGPVSVAVKLSGDATYVATVGELMNKGAVFNV